MSTRDPYDDDRFDDRDPDRRDDRDHNYDDYEDGPRMGRREIAAQKVMLPAIFMMVFGVLGLGFTIFRTVVYLAMGPQPNPFANPNAPNAADMQKMTEIGETIGPFINLAWSIIVFMGGLQMKRLRSRGFVIFSCIFAMLPCNLVCCLGMWFAIWSLVVVCNEQVKRGFDLPPPRSESY